MSFSISPRPSSPLLADAVDKFIVSALKVNQLSRVTVFHYGHDLSIFMRYIASVLGVSPLAIPLNQITSQHVEAFLTFLTEERGNSPRSIKRRLAALRSFFAYATDPFALGETGLIYVGKNPTANIRAPRVKKADPHVLTAREAANLLRAVRAHSPNPDRDYAMFRVFLHCGATLSDILNLEMRDINVHDRCVRLSAGTERERYVPLSDGTLSALLAYLRSRPRVRCSNVFINRRRQPISRSTVSGTLARCATAAKLDPTAIKTHTLRHTCFTLLAKQGFTAPEIQRLAGFRRVGSAELYLRLAERQRRKELKDE